MPISYNLCVIVTGFTTGALIASIAIAQLLEWYGKYGRF